ncbi:type II CAAX endopeptidase family protein [Vibrio caribbeanicus]|uniref:CPBP family intramembrane glutamic endopeptidase n=1 Tax=Vibrio caribbeanicus TaxID=701175 RepID=UPI0030D7E72F
MLTILGVLFLGLFYTWAPYLIGMELQKYFFLFTGTLIQEKFSVPIYTVMHFLIIFLSIKLLKIQNQRDTEIISKKFLLIVISMCAFSVAANITFNLVAYYFFNDYHIYLYSISYSPIIYSGEGFDIRANIENFFLYCVLAPIVEELFYRRTLFQFVHQRFGFLISALISSVFFAAIHSVYVIPFLLSVILCFIYKRYGLRGAILAHAAHNITYYIGEFSYTAIKGYELTIVSKLNPVNTGMLILSSFIVIVCLVNYMKYE